jgi:hypothetical protein
MRCFKALYFGAYEIYFKFLQVAISQWSLLHTPEFCVRIKQLLSSSRNSRLFMEPKSSLPCSQAPVTGPHLDPDEFGPQPHTGCLPNTRFSIMFKPVYIFQVVISLQPYYVPISQLYCVCYMPRPYHSTLFDYPNITRLFGEENKLWSYLLWNFLQPCTTSSLLGKHIHLSSLLPNSSGNTFSLHHFSCSDKQIKHYKAINRK